MELIDWVDVMSRVNYLMTAVRSKELSEAYRTVYEEVFDLLTTAAHRACIRRRAAYRACHYTAVGARFANRNLLQRRPKHDSSRRNCSRLRLAKGAPAAV